MVSAVFLAPVTSLPHGFLAVSWSLYYEILFYCVFAFFFFINRRLGYSVLVLFALASASIHTLPLTSPYCINRINLLFLAGVIMGLFSDSAFFKRLPPILLTTAGLLLYTISIIRYVPMNHPFIYAGAIMLVAAAVAADVRTEGKTATPTGPIGQPLMWLGSISYSLYLCHVPVQAVIYRYFGSPYSSPLIAILYILAPIGIASVGYLAIEAPSQKLARLILASDQSRPHPQSLRSIPLPTVAGIPTLELPFTSMAWQENRKRLARK
jgi:peptidoglycan/LPS O-acetylase OafA/YrhL